MRIFVSASVLVSLFACGSSTGSDAELVPQVTDNVVAPTAQYLFGMKCFNPSMMASWGTKGTASQLKCCADSGCKPATASKTDSGGTTCYYDICDCGLGTSGGQKAEDKNDTTYVTSDCR